MRSKWTEKKIAKMYKSGRGEGHGADYQPWLEVLDFSSLGRSHRSLGLKTKRVHHLMSDVEKNLFWGLEWAREVVDIREQFPLDRELTMAVAGDLRLRHPYYPGTTVPTVMTVDFMVTKVFNGQSIFEAFDAKRAEDMEQETVLEKLEIQRETLRLMDIKHHVVIHSNIPTNQRSNIAWILDGLPDPEDLEKNSFQWNALREELTGMLRSCREPLTLAELCASFDARKFRERGLGLQVAKLLMYERVVKAPLSAPALYDQQVKEFVVTTSAGKLLAVGGT